jgi:hypothetical protein
MCSAVISGNNSASSGPFCEGELSKKCGFRIDKGAFSAGSFRHVISCGATLHERGGMEVAVVRFTFKTTKMKGASVPASEWENPAVSAVQVVIVGGTSR